MTTLGHISGASGNGGSEGGSFDGDNVGASASSTVGSSGSTGPAMPEGTDADAGETMAGSAESDEGEAPAFDLGATGDHRGGDSSSGEPPEPAPPYDGDCCEPGDGSGCGDDAVAACVCAVDPYCCDTGWDELCVDEVTALGCSTCEGVGPAGLDTSGDCCSAHAEPGCFDETIATCVCDVDPYCCKVQWDQVCADAVIELGCDACDAGTTGEADYDDGTSGSGGSEGTSSGTT